VVDEQPPIPLGRTGRTEVVPLANAAGDHALLVREADGPRMLLTAEPAVEGPGGLEGRDRLVVMPLDPDVDTRVDGDALAIWIATGSAPSAAPRGRRGPMSVPVWASAFGFVLVFLILLFTVVGSAVMFRWLLDALGAL
jgi:hypothetical protein